MIGIIVATPLQVFNSLIIMRHFFPGEKCDLFALDITCDMHPVLQNYSNIGIIESVYYMTDIWQHRGPLSVFWAHVKMTPDQKKMIKNVSQKKYTHLLSTWVGMNSTWLYNKMILKSPNLKVHFYEEGIGIYTSYLYKNFNGIRYMYKLLGYKFEEDVLEDIFMYRPEICIDVNSKFQRRAIGKINMNDFNFLKPLFKNTSIKSYKSKLIYFDSNFKKTRFEGFDEIEVIKLILSKIDKNRVLIRTHPRSTPQKYMERGLETDGNTNAIWEYILSSGALPEETILVAPFSSALFTPKFILDLEPRVIILGKAIKNEHLEDAWSEYFWTSNLEHMCLEFKSLYHDKSRVMIPNNYNEVVRLLDMWG